ncbi:MAG: DUF502 domain-containing protein [Planctomycetes bacterium]|nr:DUF502 domain-containing protein [Planctomycetota bacterium]
MKALGDFIRTTLIGGILFLLPIVVLIAVLGKAQDIASRIVAPVAQRMPVPSVGGVAVAKILAIVVIALFCFLAGLLARTRFARKGVGWLEGGLLSLVPGYDFFKGISESLVGHEKDHAHEVVLARIEESWQIGFLMERVEPDHYAVFVPGAPSIWSGSVYFMTEDRFQRIHISRAEAMKCLRQLGEGTNQLLAGRIVQAHPTG